MRQLAAMQGIPVIDSEDINAQTARDAIFEIKPDLLVVCDYGQILAHETLSLAKYGGLNLHASLLPKYRGAAPINWAIYHGEVLTGNTVIRMNVGIDAGPIVAQQEVRIEPDETSLELEQRLAQEGAALVLGAINDLQSDNLHGREQDRAQMTRAPKLKKSDGEIDWSRCAEEIYNHIRAMVPWPKTYTYWLREQGAPVRLIIESAVVETGDSHGPAGEVLEAEKDRLLVDTGQGILRLVQLQPAGKRSLGVGDFLRGYPISPGDHLGAARSEIQ
jgi:methionyl-tRNA formyltransferase